MIATCIRDWPSHFVKVGETCKYEPSDSIGYIIKFPQIGWTSIGERKFKR